MINLHPQVICRRFILLVQTKEGVNEASPDICDIYTEIYNMCSLIKFSSSSRNIEVKYILKEHLSNDQKNRPNQYKNN